MSSRHGLVGQPPSQTKGEVAQGLIRAAVAGVPVVGGPAAEVIGLVLQPAFERRREQWLQDLAGAFEELRRRMDDFDPDRLAENEVFITAVAVASNAALRTHEAEKRTALRNAVVSSATSDLDEFEQLTFIRYVDELTAFHLLLLVYLRDPSGWFDRHDIEKPQNLLSSSGENLLEFGMPELAGHQDRYRQALGDLGSRGLADAGAMSGMVTADGLWVPRTTALGNRFMDYISEPGE